MNSPRLTINDIAKLAGVSRSTVSRVLNECTDVSEVTRQQVREVMEKYHYRPSIYARQNVLHIGKINSVGIFIGQRIRILASNTEILRGVITKAAEESLDTIICGAKRTEQLIDMYNERKVSGFVILNPYLQDRKMLEALQQNGVPFVCTEVCGVPNQFDCVDVDNETAAYHMVELLIQSGHTNIAVLKDPNMHESMRLRLVGYRRCLERYGIPYRPEWIHTLDDEKGSQTIDDLREQLRGEASITALFAFSDALALNAINHFRKHNIFVPEDISVVGFDDLTEVLMGFPLTTVRQDFYSRGYRACERLLVQISEERQEENKRWEFVSHQLKVRQTVQLLQK